MPARGVRSGNPMSGSNLFGEIRRFARTSGAVGGIAARVAGERMFGIKTDRAAHAEDLRTILGGLKGPLMKVAQFLSTVPDALPVEYAEELAQLQSNAPAMGWNFVRRRMASELGPDWRPNSPSFSQEASAAASLGQVHRATLAGRHRGRLQAAISRHAQHRGGRPAPVEAGHGGLSPDGQRHPARRDLQGTARTPARGTGLRARSRADAAVRPDAEGPARACTCRCRCPASAPTAC